MVTWRGYSGANRDAGGQIKGGKAANADMGGGVRWEWTFSQVDRRSNTRRVGGV